MLVKVNKNDMKDLAGKILPFSGGARMPTTGVVGLTFTQDKLVMRVFSGIWAWGEIPCDTEGFTENMFLAIRSNGIRAILMYCGGDDSDEDISLNVTSKIKVKSTVINTLDNWKEDDLTPNVDLDNAHWINIPGQVKDVISSSLTDSAGYGYTSTLHFGPNGALAWCKNSAQASMYFFDWELDEYVDIPYVIAHSIIAKEIDVAFFATDKLVVVSHSNLHVASPLQGDATEFPSEKALIEGGTKLTKQGIISGDIMTELNIACLQSEHPVILMWTNDEAPNMLLFHAPGSEEGHVSGSVWSSLQDFRFVCNADMLRKLMPVDLMYKANLALLSDNNDVVTLVIETEEGVRHILSPTSCTEEKFQEAIDKHANRPSVGGHGESHQ